VGSNFKVNDKLICVFQSSNQLETGEIYTVKETYIRHTIQLLKFKEIDSIMGFSARSFRHV